MMAWLHTILRNEFYGSFRKRRREVPDSDGVFAARLSSLPAQEGKIELANFRVALGKLPPASREVLIRLCQVNRGWRIEGGSGETAAMRTAPPSTQRRRRKTRFAAERETPHQPLSKQSG
jgi:hypothetical protein